MDRVYMDNVDRYQGLIKAYKPPKLGAKEAETVSSPDMIVSARIRPLLEDELFAGIVPGVFLRDQATASVPVIDLHELRKTVRWGPQINSSCYRLDHVFGPDSTTDEVYEAFVKPLLPWAWGGGVGTLFAYGQTGSGKTFTVSAIEKLTAETLLGGSLGGERRIHCSIIELAGQSAFDLLNSRKPIQVLEDSFGVIQLTGAFEHRIESKKTLLEYIESAASFRKSAQTLKNDDSSRSHAICRIRIQNPALPAAEDGLLYMVDLAGSEAARDVSTHGADRMRETREINASLSVLKDCIRGRADADATPFTVVKGKVVAAKKPHVPFRQSTLTKVLKHVFDPATTRSCKTAVVACVNPSFLDVGASKNTLRYAETLRVLVPNSTKVQYDPAVPVTWSNEQLREWTDRNSGSPPISSSDLAPTESGPQILRLPIPEFLTRCLKNPSTAPEQARAFRAKLWRLHVDSQKTAALTSSIKSSSAIDKLSTGLKSSQDSLLAHNSLPFKQRIRPGMVIRWSPPSDFPMRQHGLNYAIILCPTSALETPIQDVTGYRISNFATEAKAKAGAEADTKTEAGESMPIPANGNPRKYLCSLVKRGLMLDSHEVMLWQHVIIDEEQMEAEVHLEYISATRYYGITV